MALGKTMLVELRGRDQIEAVTSSLQGIVGTGTSVVFSFLKPGRATVLFANLSSRSAVKEKLREADEDHDQTVGDLATEARETR